MSKDHLKRDTVEGVFVFVIDHVLQTSYLGTPCFQPIPELSNIKLRLDAVHLAELTGKINIYGML